MLNLAGSSYDFGNVLFAVLQDCEHQRRALLPNQAEARLAEIARAKLAEIRESYEECGGTEPYWRSLEREVMQTAMPQYVPAAIEQNRLEKGNYDLWRQGDPAARALFGLIGLVIGGLIIAAPFIPIWEDAFAFALAAAGFLYPEIKKTVHDYRHSRLLNRLIAQAEKYQRDERIHYVSEARLQEELDAVETTRRMQGRKVIEHPSAPRGKERT
jgi:hypothetical protein